MKTIKPIGNKIAFSVIERKINEFDANGLVAPTAEEYHEKLIATGLVIAIGNDVTMVEVGDEIIVNLTSVVDIKPTGYNVQIIAELDVIAVVK